MKCLECNKETINPKFCCISCSTTFNNRKYPKRKKEEYFCLWCGADIKRDGCCSRKCRRLYNTYIYINKWMLHIVDGMRGKSGVSVYVKRFLFDKYNNSCQQCGWGVINKYTNKVPLDIHHKDGNCMNSYYENIELLCPNCHHLTDNYGARNKGNVITSKERLGYI